MKKSLSMLLAGAMLVSALAGCGGNTSSSSETSSTDESTASGTAFKVGGTAPLTGTAAIYGNAVKNGAELAAEEINAEGGDIQFEVVFEDDENNTEKAVSAYNALKDEGIQLSLGAVTSKPGEAIAPLLEEDHIFALTPSASSPANIENNDVVFQMCFSDPNQGLASADYIADQQLGTKIASSIRATTYTPPASSSSSRPRHRPRAWRSWRKSPLWTAWTRISPCSSMPASPPARTCCSCRSTTPRRP